MKSLFEIDFEKDSFKQYIFSFVKDTNKVKKIILAYRFAKYAYLNKYFKNTNEPKMAIQILIQEFNITNFNSIITLLLSYVTRCSFLLTTDDIIDIFGTEINERIKTIDIIEKIVNSGARITDVKRKKYKTIFSKEIIAITAAYTLAALKTLELNKSKTFPIKIYERYLPIFDICVDIRLIVALKLKKWLIRKVNNAQKLKDYNFTSGDIFKYWSIINSAKSQTSSTF